MNLKLIGAILGGIITCGVMAAIYGVVSHLIWNFRLSSLLRKNRPARIKDLTTFLGVSGGRNSGRWLHYLDSEADNAEFNLEVQHPAKRPLLGLKIRDTFSVGC